jgi:hypothetical protein
MRTIIWICLLVLLSACTRRAFEKITAFPADARPLSKALVAEAGGWKVTRESAGSVPVFQVLEGMCDGCFLSFRAQVKTEDVTGRVFPEMWVQVPGKGEFFSKGFDQSFSGTRDWAAVDIPFRLEPGQLPDVVSLNLAFEGRGTAWVREVELWKRPF